MGAEGGTGHRPIRVRPWAALPVDAGAWALGLMAAVLTRYEFALSRRQLAATMCIVLLAIMLSTALMLVWYLRYTESPILRRRPGLGRSPDVTGSVGA